jgi:hypothetical protein
MKTRKKNNRKDFPNNNKKTERSKNSKISRISKKRNRKEKVQGNIVSEKEGWTIIQIYGESYEMGYAHGYLLANVLREIRHTFPFIVKNDLKIPFSQYLEKSNVLIKPVIKSRYPEIYKEIKGISDGAKKKGVDVSVDFLISWNSYMSLYSIFEKGSIENRNVSQNGENNVKQRCSAFIATGTATEKGDIVMAHNTHSSFIDGKFMNVILYVKPSKRIHFMMQTSPGYVSSISDWFICESGIIGCETTIAYTNYKPSFGNPSFCRIREVMQYSTSLDDCVRIMLDGNAGDYASSWQFGNVNTGEIMLLEIGLEKYNVQRTMNGVYYGMNSAIDWTLRKTETNDIHIFNPKKPTGSRNLRLNYLLNEKYYGKINIQNAKRVLADHYDMFLGKRQMNGRSICKHGEQDPPIENNRVSPHGCIDGKVVNTTMAKKMKFVGKFGASCNRVFKTNEFLKMHDEYEKLKHYLRDFPLYKWTDIGI